ncbi:MAG: sigma-70 family RNA polymerase sigma factor [Opitutaceae bacterium]|nr:sigma-70 family RNA polymerase sigma factor [Opitutaceae bacterium]
MNDATLLLAAVGNGEPEAAERFLVVVYQELRALASNRMARERAPQTLQPTALVHEAWLRLIASRNPRFANRAHFFAAAAEAMRRILIDRARRRMAQRHGGGQETAELDVEGIVATQPDEQMIAVHESLDAMAQLYPRQAELVKLRYFAGLTLEETAELLGVSLSTAKNDWMFARTWLFRELERK